jgi:queuine tRNA-ribosyltransferase
VDTFDSAYPTRSGRHGNLFHSSGNVIKLSNTQFIDSFSPIDDKCNCYTCKNYSIAYLHHLYKMNEPTYGTLGSIHNIHFIINLMSVKRKQILNDEI